MADWRDFLALADRHTPGFRKAYVKAVTTAAQGVNPKLLRRYLRKGMYSQATNLLASAWQNAAAGWETELAKKAFDLMGQAGELAAQTVPQMAGRFDLVNPRAVQWAKTRAAALVVQSTEAQREAIRNIIGESVSGDYTKDVAARRITQVVGLDAKRAAALHAFDVRLAAGVAKMQLAGATQKAVEKALLKAELAVERYRKRLLNQRGQTIARTEVMAATNAGQLEAWQQARDKGLLAPSMFKQWILTPDDRLCPLCRQMRKVKVPVDQAFNTPLGTIMHPPMHPNCRCTVGVIRIPKKSALAPPPPPPPVIKKVKPPKPGAGVMDTAVLAALPPAPPPLPVVQALTAPDHVLLGNGTVARLDNVDVPLGTWHEALPANLPDEAKVLKNGHVYPKTGPGGQLGEFNFETNTFVTQAEIDAQKMQAHVLGLMDNEQSFLLAEMTPEWHAASVDLINSGQLTGKQIDLIAKKVAFENGAATVAKAAADAGLPVSGAQGVKSAYQLAQAAHLTAEETVVALQWSYTGQVNLLDDAIAHIRKLKDWGLDPVAPQLFEGKTVGQWIQHYVQGAEKWYEPADAQLFKHTVKALSPAQQQAIVERVLNDGTSFQKAMDDLVDSLPQWKGGGNLDDLLPGQWVDFQGNVWQGAKGGDVKVGTWKFELPKMTPDQYLDDLGTITNQQGVVAQQGWLKGPPPPSLEEIAAAAQKAEAAALESAVNKGGLDLTFEEGEALAKQMESFLGEAMQDQATYEGLKPLVDQATTVQKAKALKLVADEGMQIDDALKHVLGSKPGASVEELMALLGEDMPPATQAFLDGAAPDAAFHYSGSYASKKAAVKAAKKGVASGKFVPGSVAEFDTTTGAWRVKVPSKAVTGADPAVAAAAPKPVPSVALKVPKAPKVEKKIIADLSVGDTLDIDALEMAGYTLKQSNVHQGQFYLVKAHKIVKSPGGSYPYLDAQGKVLSWGSKEYGGKVVKVKLPLKPAGGVQAPSAQAVTVPPPSVPKVLKPGDTGTTEWIDRVMQHQVSPAKGSNPGGLFEAPDGSRWYVKLYKDPGQAYSEQLANAIYNDLGVGAPQSFVMPTSTGQVAYASKWLDDVVGTLGNAGLSAERANKVLDGFVADVFTANWDAVGTGLDNVVRLANGELRRIDMGGALLYRAQGALKPVAGLKQIGEWESLLTHNAYYRQVFEAAGLAEADELGARAVAQIDRVLHLVSKPKEKRLWLEYVNARTPNAPLSQREAMAEMLYERAQKLAGKRTELQALMEGQAARPSTPGTWLYGDADVRRTHKLTAAQRTQAEALPSGPRSSIRSYTGASYSDVNDALRGALLEGQPIGRYEAEAIRKMDQGLDPERHAAMLVWRGTPLHGKARDQMEKAIAAWKAGKTGKDAQVVMGGYSSASVRPTGAWGYGQAAPGNGRYCFEIETTRGLYVKPISHHPSEDEFLLPRDAIVEVVGQKQVQFESHTGKVWVTMVRVVGLKR